MKAILLLAFVLFAQKCSAEVPASMAEWIKEADKSVTKALSDMKKDLGMSEHPTGDEIVKLIKAKTDEAAKNIKGMGDKLEEQIKKNPEANNAINNLKKNMKEIVEKMKKENPEMTNNAIKLSESLGSYWKSMSEEVSKTFSELNKNNKLSEQVETIMKQTLDKGLKDIQDLHQNVQKQLNTKS